MKFGLSSDCNFLMEMAWGTVYDQRYNQQIALASLWLLPQQGLNLKDLQKSGDLWVLLLSATATSAWLVGSQTPLRQWCSLVCALRHLAFIFWAALCQL